MSSERGKGGGFFGIEYIHMHYIWKKMQKIKKFANKLLTIVEKWCIMALPF